jgi:hemoglobin-like flavoprotein
MTGIYSSIDPQQLREYRAGGAAAESAISNLSPTTVRHVREVWAESEAADGSFAAELYTNLFAIAPGAASLFTGDLSRQQQRLSRTLADSLAFLDNPRELLLLLKASGTRHLHYQTGFEHFALLAQALDKTFRQRLGQRYTPTRRKAWKLLFSQMSAVMSGAMAAGIAAAR